MTCYATNALSLSLLSRRDRSCRAVTTSSPGPPSKVLRNEVHICTASRRPLRIAIVRQPKEQLRNPMPPITHQPTPKRIAAAPDSRRIAGPLQPIRIVEEARARRLVARAGIDLHRLPLGIERGVGDHDETPGKGARQVEELVKGCNARRRRQSGVVFRLDLFQVARDAVCAVCGKGCVAEAGANVVALTVFGGGGGCQLMGR